MIKISAIAALASSLLGEMPFCYVRSTLSFLVSSHRLKTLTRQHYPEMWFFSVPSH